MVADLDRRSFLLGAAAAAAAGARLPAGLAQAATAPATIALPSPARVRADFQRMVDCGPRYTGAAGHEKYIDWLETELVKAGVIMRPREQLPLTIWEATHHSLDLLDGSDAGPVLVSGYVPRSQETGDNGITGPLVYAGVAPLPALDVGLQGLQAAIQAYPDQLTSWAEGLVGTLGGGVSGAIVLVDLPFPAPLPLAALLALSSYLHWPGHDITDWLKTDYKRTELLPGLAGLPLAPFQALGAKGVVFIYDASAAAIDGGYMPFESGFEPLPGLFVDRDTGNRLRRAALSRPKARLTLAANRRKGTSPALLGYLPGSKSLDECVFVNTHTDGEGFVEENGGVALVHLARHFGSLRGSDRLERALVFSLWPGHMTTGMQQLGGVIASHPDVIASSIAGITVEHLGTTEWLDTANVGYHATGQPEPLFTWTTQGGMFDLVKDALVLADLPRTALMRPPVQFGVGGDLQGEGVPQAGIISGPYYLLNDAPGSDMDKLDEGLAARQIAWVAEIIRRLDKVNAASLTGGDPTLGTRKSTKRASFPPLPDVSLRVKVTTSKASLRTGSKLRGTVALNRTGAVRIHASVEYHRHGRTVSTGLADKLVHVAGGTLRFALSTNARARAALHHAGAKVVLEARYRERGQLTRTRVTR